VITEQIGNIRISENAKIMLYLLRILSYLRLGKTESIIDLIEKIFLESFESKKISMIRPLFDFVYFLSFKLVEHYDYFK